MNLYEDKELFEQLIIRASEQFKISQAIVEKDYYVTKLLQAIIGEQPDVVFKGGTSLSKCYHLINRFSEDIDLNFDTHGEKITEGKRKKLSQSIKKVGSDMGFELDNPEEIKSRRNFNKYMFRYHSDQERVAINPLLIVEVAVAIKSFPTETMKADSLIYQYLQSEERTDIITQYNLEPFDIMVQTKERTFVDKVFAICDYYLQDRIRERSRHIYDLYKLYPLMSNEREMKDLVQEVREARKQSPVCPSAQDDCNIEELLQKIIDEDVYKSDYQNITQNLLFQDVPYEVVIQTLSDIKNMEIWGDMK